MQVRDPVCGKQIDLGDAVASINHEGWAYFFCSINCRNEFKRAPGSFAAKPDMASGSSEQKTTAS
jgi:YHS domain-containing protein